MKFFALTLFPEKVQEVCTFGVIGQAYKKKLFDLQTVQVRDFAQGVHKSVDEAPFGGGDGMVMLYEPLSKAIESIPNWKKMHKIYLSPQGQIWSQSKALEYSKKYSELILVSGRYGGVDQRFLNEYIDEEISIGDFILSGGEWAIAVIIDTWVRLLPGALGHEDSSSHDSWSEGLRGLLEPPPFTRPRILHKMATDTSAPVPSIEESPPGSEVPAVLLSGHHQRIHQWRTMISYLVTLYKRPEVFHRIVQLDSNQKNELLEFWNQLSDSERRALGFKNWKLDLQLLERKS